MSERSPKSFTLFKRGTYTLLIILALLFAFSRVEKSRGNRNWQAAKAELQASGLTVDWAEATPRPVPDAQNLAMSRVLTGCYRAEGNWSLVGDWQAEPVFDEAATTAANQAQALYAPSQQSSVEDAFGFSVSKTESLNVFGDTDAERFEALAELLAPHRGSLKELRSECARRPQSYLPGDYTLSATSPIPDFKMVRTTTQLLTAEAILALHEGNYALALENCQVINRVANLNPQTPFLVNTMIKAVVLRSYLAELLWQGISEDVFNEAQLAEVIVLCQQNDQVKDLGRSFEAEILFAISTIQEFNQSPLEISQIFGSQGYPLLLGWDQTFDALMHRIIWYLTPAEGWNLKMSGRLLEFVSDYYSAFDLDHGTIDLDQIDQMAEALEQLQENDAFFDSLLLMSVPAYQNVAKIAVDTQRRLDLIEIAATLILSVKQGYPLPESITSGFEIFPTDPTNNQPYSYHKTADSFTISSEREDGSLDLVVHWTPRKR